MTNREGTPKVSIVITTCDSEKFVSDCINSVMNLDYPQDQLEVIVVDDASTDGTFDLVKQLKEIHPDVNVKLFRNEKRSGTAVSKNFGIGVAENEYVASVDSDVALTPSWLRALVPELQDTLVAAAGGMICTYPAEELVSRLAGYELEYRYTHLKAKSVDKVSSANTIYKKSLLQKIGLFPSDLINGEDTFVSYRFRDLGYKLVINKEAICYHRWKATLRDYLRQQFFNAYGKSLVNWKLGGGRILGDKISSWKMIVHVPLTMALLVSLFASLFQPLILSVSVILFFIILSLSIPAAIWIFKSKREKHGFFLPFIAVLRNLSWLLGSIYGIIQIFTGLPKQA